MGFSPVRRIVTPESINCPGHIIISTGWDIKLPSRTTKGEEGLIKLIATVTTSL